MGQIWESEWINSIRFGNGGQGETYRVTRKSDGTPGVLKKLKNNKKETSRARMNREAANLKLLNKVEGANVPRVLDDNTHLYDDTRKPQLFIVTEFIEGPTLAEFVASGNTLSLDDASTLVLNASKTVRVAFKEKILHRDLKPSNIILRNNDLSDPVIIDYGLSFNASDEGVTEAGEPIGNEFLRLPEMHTPDSDRRDERSDITALAGILCYLITGDFPGTLGDGEGMPPHRRKNSIRDVLGEDPRTFPLEAFFDKSFQPSMADRFQTIDEFEDRLRSLVSQQFRSNDLSTIAKLAYAQIASADRNTQLAEIANQVTLPLRQAAAVFQSSTDVAPLKLGVGAGGVLGGGFGRALVTHPTYDVIPQASVTLTLDSPAKELARFQFLIGAKEKECVLLGQMRRAGSTQVNPDEWTELCWFTFSSNEEDLEDLEASLQGGFRQMLYSYLERIAKDGWKEKETKDNAV